MAEYAVDQLALDTAAGLHVPDLGGRSMFHSICPLQAISRPLFILIVVAPYEFRRTVRHLALFVPPPHQQPLRIRNHDGGAGLRNCTPPCILTAALA